MNVNLQYVSKDSTGISSVYARECLDRSDVSVKIYSFAGILPGKIEGGLVEHPDERFSRGKKSTVYLGCFLYAWGHCLTNNLSRVWAAQRIMEENPDVVFAYTSLTPGVGIPAYFADILERLGIPQDRLMEIESPTCFEELYVPDECFLSDPQDFKTFTKEYIEVIQKLIDSCAEVEIRTYDRIYFSREKIQDGKDIGENRLSEVFKQLGYQIIFPEYLSLDQQIWLLQHCSFFAATEGSVAHNAIFMRNGANVVLLRKANYCNTFQVAINKARQLNVTYIDVNKSNVLPHDVRICWGPFFLYQSRELSRFAGIKPVPFPVGSYVKYVANYYANSTFVHNLKHMPNLIMRKVLGAKNYSALKRILKKR